MTNTTRECHHMMSFDTFKAYLEFLDGLDVDHARRREIGDAVSKLMEMAAKDALELGTLTFEVEQEGIDG